MTRRAGSLLMVVAASAVVCAVAPAQSETLQLRDRVLRPNELAGFAPSRTVTAHDLKSWGKVAPSALTNLAVRLRDEGFVAAVREDLSASTNDRGGLSIVLQLKTSGAAKTELAAQQRDYATQANRLPGHTYKPFTVSSIPGARGFTSHDPNGVTGINVIFADAYFVYHVGGGAADNAKNPPTKDALIRAATHLYRRVHSG